jgi:hypothetical protein
MTIMTLVSVFSYNTKPKTADHSSRKLDRLSTTLWQSLVRLVREVPSLPWTDLPKSHPEVRASDVEVRLMQKAHVRDQTRPLVCRFRLMGVNVSVANVDECVAR